MDFSDIDFSKKGDHEFLDDGFGFCVICIKRNCQFTKERFKKTFKETAKEKSKETADHF